MLCSINPLALPIPYGIHMAAAVALLASVLERLLVLVGVRLPHAPAAPLGALATSVAARNSTNWRTEGDRTCQHARHGPEYRVGVGVECAAEGGDARAGRNTQGRGTATAH